VGELIDSFGFRGRLETVKSGAEETETGQTPFCNGRKRTEVRNALGISVLGCREAEMIKVCAHGHVGIVGKWGLVEAALHMSNDNAHRGGGSALSENFGKVAQLQSALSQKGFGVLCLWATITNQDVKSSFALSTMKV
jgi:hypothetical protein